MEFTEDFDILNEEINKNQATINIGTIGHVAHGKTTTVEALTGINTIKFKDEKKNNITKQLGYANAKIYKCNKCNNYDSFGSSQKTDPICIYCKKEGQENYMKLFVHVSFIDCPGHDKLMSTMMSSVDSMDFCLLLISANQSFPQPQTSEHLIAVETCNLKDIIIIQNKVDLVKKEEAVEQYHQIKQGMKNTNAENSPIIPISAKKKVNIDLLCKILAENIPIPKRNLVLPPKFNVLRSFDINKPGCKIEDLRGGVAGGTIKQGVFKLGDIIEIRPGLVREDKGNFICEPIINEIISLRAENNDLKYAIPGGLIAIGTNLDPELCISNNLVGQTIGIHGSKMDDIYSKIKIKYYLLHSLLGHETSQKITDLILNEQLILNISCSALLCKVMSIENKGRNKIAKISLSRPICISKGDNIAISRKIDSNIRLIGKGTFISGLKCQI